MRPVLEPDVTVVVGAYDAMPYLVDCLASVAAQTIGADRMEVIAVDDGSSDGTGDYLEEYARTGPLLMTVIRQTNSGSPSGPRNLGLDCARGRYVFFLDADDRLGPQALQRMVAMADEAGTDVIAGRVEGINRSAPQSMWKRTTPRADVFDSQLMFALSAQKLFRRKALLSMGLRFDESLKTGEDSLFTLEAYLRGRGVSVIADYTCYYLVGRADGKQVTRTGDYRWRFPSALALMELIERLVPPGRRRDRLMVRPFTVTVLNQFRPKIVAEPSERIRERIDLAAPLMNRYWTAKVARHMRVADRLRLECVARQRLDLLTELLRFLADGRTPKVVRRGFRLFLAYPRFGTGVLPRSAYQITFTETVGTAKVRPLSDWRTWWRRLIRRMVRRAR